MNFISDDFSYAPPKVGRHGMIATSQPLATTTGLSILKSGGSAVDAAIAANAVLSITEPHMCGPGGDLFAMVWDHEAQQLHGINGSGASPQALSRTVLIDGLRGRASIPQRGRWTLTTPGAVAAWAALHARFGRLPWRALFAPAIDIARDGFAVGVRTSLWWQRAAREIARDPELTGRSAPFDHVFMQHGAAPEAGELRRNLGLARLYEALADRGAEEFYRGEVARDLLRELAALDAYLSAADLAAHETRWVTPIDTRYRGHRVHVLPPNGQGLCALQMLNLLETQPPQAHGPHSAQWWHLFLEAKKLAFADRAQYYADPDFAAVPVSELLSPAYTARRASLLDPYRARADQTPGRVSVPAGDTTYLTVADAHGQMVSLIQSLFVPFGSALVAPTYGMALQSRATGFALAADHPNVYAPGKRPFHTIMPGFVTRDGAPVFSFGAIGGDMQPQAQVQILARVLEFGCDIATAGALPRMRHVGGNNPNGIAEPPLGVVHYEPSMPEAIVSELLGRGHELVMTQEPIGGFVGGYQGIWRDHARGCYFGASDHRLDGCALGY